ncbi:MAG: hypothetical protein JNK82_26190 [Myxococcaceae bacterium]|nr:hypothetical protein [Myxococcaceae bacterium]
MAIATMGFVGACRCPGEDPNPPVCPTVVVTIESPTAGATVPSTLTVTASAKRDGADIDLTGALVQSRLTSDTSFGATQMGTVTGNRATFSGVPLQTGDNVVRVVLETAGVGDSPSCSGAATVDVTVDPAMPGAVDVTSFTFAGDANNDKILNDAEATTAGGIIANIATTNAVGCSLVVTEVGSSTARGTVPMIPVNGVATVTLTGFANPMQGDYNLEARITCAGRTHDVANDPEARTMLSIDRVRPTCMLVDPSVAIIGPANDADPNAAGYQLRTFGTAMDANPIEIELSLTGGATPQTTGFQPPMNGGLLRDFTIPAAGAVLYTVVMSVRDEAGNTCAATRPVRSDFVAPVVTITAPANGGTFNMFTMQVTANVTDEGMNVEDSQMVCTSNNGSIGGPFDVNGNTATGTGNFMAGTYTISCTVTDAAGNTSAPATSTFTVTGGAGCPLVFTNPMMSPATLTRSSGVVVGNQLTFTFATQTSAACAGRTIRIEQVIGAMRTLIGMGPASAGGVFQQSATLTDSGGAQLTFVATIDDGMGNMTPVTQIVVVALDTPTILQPAAGIINVSADVSTTTPGVQRLLQYQPTTPVGATCTICSDVALTDAGVGCPDGMGFTYQTNVPTPSNTFTFPDGVYSLKPVFVFGAGGHSSGAYLAYTVDSIRPRVTAITFGGDANNDNILNGTELPMGNPVMNVTFTGVENGRAVTVVNTANSMDVGTGTVTANAAAVTLTGLNLTGTTDATFELEVRVSDAANNPNNFPVGNTTINPEAVKTLRVDRVAPTCTFTAPTKAQLGTADDASAVMGYQLRATVSTSSDVTGMTGVTIALGGAAMMNASGAATGGLYSNDFTVSGTGELDYTLTATCVDAALNSTTSTVVNVRVDNQPPTACMITQPMGSTVFSNGALSTTVIATNANGIVPVITSTAGGGGNLPAMAAGTSTGVINYVDGMMQTITATLTDPAGNFCTATQVISVQNAGCNVVFTSPAAAAVSFGKPDDTMPASPTTVERALVGEAANCPNALVRLFRGTPGTQVDMVTTNGMGQFSFNISLPSGTEHFEARMDNGVQATLDAVDITVDLIDPQVSGLTPAGTTLVVVAPGNNNVRLGAAGYVVDANTGMADGQVAFSVNVIDAVGGQITVLYNGSPVFPATGVASTPQTFNGTLTLGQSTTGPLIVRVRDAAGNQIETTLNATVDVVAPNAPTVSANVIAGQDRAANVSATWNAVGDDEAAGTPTGYDVRWTTALIQPTGLATSDDFFDSSKANPESTGTMTSATIRVPTLNSYYFYVRAFDEVGNYSTFQTAMRVDNPLTATRQAFANPRVGGATSDFFGMYMAAGRINADSFDDLVVGNDASAVNNVYVYYGSATGLGATPQAIVSHDGTTNVGWGRPIAVGKPSSTTSNDVLVSSFSHAGLGAGAPATAGIAVLYFGGAGTQLDTTAANYVRFSGTVATGNFGRALAFIPDINEDGLDEIAISAPVEGTNRAGNVYLWYGRSQAAWKALPQPILSTSADRIFTGPPQATLPANARFGRRSGGYANLGRAGTTGPKDFAIPASFQVLNSLYMFSGATVNAGSAGMTFPSSSAFQTMSPGVSSGDLERGFGSRAIGDVDVMMSTASDLFVSDPQNSAVYIYADRTATFPSAGSPSATIAEVGSFQAGTDFQVVDFDGDGRLDLFIGSYSAATSLTTTGVFIYPNRGGMTPFDNAAGARFYRSKISPLATGSSMGTAVVIGNFNGDSQLDLAVADHLDGIGKVFVWQ